MHHQSLAIVFAATGYMLGASAFPTDRPLVKMEVATTSVTVADEVDNLNSIDKRASIFDICSKGYNPPPPVRTDNLSRFLNIEAARGVAPTTSIGDRQLAIVMSNSKHGPPTTSANSMAAFASDSIRFSTSLAKNSDGPSAGDVEALKVVFVTAL
ncbi:hypothetical protein CMEL01_02928 [Colletotrichum melonis]|uniref:Uncharacterized protein n=1 Tax=Colletotrichum melonis TaxID=1209925 RepID=A0AAI9UPW2_9PEZI|nr:hypothetical protein CMEL01_02928 [Colletotrichum melonis]